MFNTIAVWRSDVDPALLAVPHGMDVRTPDHGPVVVQTVPAVEVDEEPVPHDARHRCHADQIHVRVPYIHRLQLHAYADWGNRAVEDVVDMREVGLWRHAAAGTAGRVRRPCEVGRAVEVEQRRSGWL